MKHKTSTGAKEPRYEAHGNIKPGQVTATNKKWEQVCVDWERRQNQDRGTKERIIL